VFTSYGRLLAASGFVAVTFNHGFSGPERLLDAAADVDGAIAHVRANADELGIDPDRIALWAFSGGGPFLSAAMRDRPPFVRALVAFYAILDLRAKPPGASAAVTDEMRRDARPAFSAKLVSRCPAPSGGCARRGGRATARRGRAAATPRRSPG